MIENSVGTKSDSPNWCVRFFDKNDPILVRYNFPDSILQILKFDINIFKWRNKWMISCSIFHARQSHRLQFVFLALFIINHLHWRSIILTRHVERPFHYPPRFNFNVKVKLVFIIFWEWRKQERLYSETSRSYPMSSSL